jgi:mono/diheme cytochrome c family protein
VLYRLARVRRLAPLALALLLLAGAAAGCSSSKPGENTVSPLPTNHATVAVTTTAAAVPAQYKDGDPAAGKKVFQTGPCAGCHTLADAGTHGNVGPNLDQAKPPLSLVVDRVVHGKGNMPALKGQLSDKQIADVAAYVVKATGGSANG